MSERRLSCLLEGTVRNEALGEVQTLNRGITDSRQPGNVQAALASAPAAHILPTFGISLQKFKPKRKATENADPFGDRVHKAAALSATNDGVSNLFNGEDDDDEDWEGMTAKHDHNLQGGTPAETSADFNVIEIRSTNLAIPILKIGAWVPDDVGLEDWQPLGNLESDVGITIHEKFLTHFASHDTKRAAYGAVARNAARYMDGGICVNMAVWQKGCGQSAFEKAYGNKHRACDTCIRTKRLCVRVVADESGAKLCVFPLPEVRREGRTLCSIAAWVIGG